MQVNGYALALMVFSISGEVFCLLLGKGVRLIAFFAAATALLAVAALPPWRDALAGVFGTGPGMVVLVLMAFFFGLAYAIDHIRHLHVVRTPILGTIAGTALILAWAMRSQLGAQGAKLGPKTAAAIGQASQQIQSGHAAAAETGSERAVIFALAAVAVFALWRLRKHLHKRRPFAHAQPFGAIAGGSRAALPAGSGGSGGPGGSGKGAKPGFLARLTGR
jgi:hypothetical protein